MKYGFIFLCGCIVSAAICYAWLNNSEQGGRLVIQTNKIVQYRTGPPIVRWKTNKEYYTNNITNYIFALESDLSQFETNAGWIKVVKGWIHAGLYKRAWKVPYSIERGKKNTLSLIAGQTVGVGYMRDILGIQAGANILFYDGKVLFSITGGLKF